MTEQDIMNAYYSRTAIEVFRLGKWQKAIPKDVNVAGSAGLRHVNLQLLKPDGFPSRETEVVAQDEFASRLRRATVDASPKIV